MEAPYNIKNHRREQCERCPTPCEYQNNVAFRTDGDNACPKNRWMAYKLFKRVKLKGAGDLVAKFADPIAGAIDMISGGKTKLRGCAACAKRKEMLNQYVPFM
jgi:hypothetical protein